MENIIYDIDTIDGHYIGKLIDTNIYEYHLSHAAPLFLKMPKQYSERTSNNDAWIAGEYKGRDSILQTGLYNDTYVNSVRYENYLDIKQSLLSTKTDFDDSVEITDNLGDFFKKAWGKNDYEIAEALAILGHRAKADNTREKILNIKIDFMGFNHFRSNNWQEQLFSDKEYTRRLKAMAKNLIPDTYIEFTSENVKDQGLLEKLQEEGILNKGVSYRKYFNLIAKGNFKISKDTFQTIKKHIKKELQKLPLSQAKRNQLLNNLQGKNGVTHQNIATVIEGMIQDLQKDIDQMTQELGNDTGVTINVFNRTMQNGLKNPATKNLFDKPIQVAKDKKELHKNYKKAFTTAMQDTINNNNTRMKNSKNIQQEEIMKIYKKGKNKKLAKNQLTTNEILELNTKLDGTDIKYGDFIRDNVDKIGKEQIKINEAGGTGYESIKGY